MPTFAQHPFDAFATTPAVPPEWQHLPEEVAAKALFGIQTLYSTVVGNAEDLATAYYMELQLAEVDEPELTAKEIAAFQLGAQFSLASMLELLRSYGVLDDTRLAQLVSAVTRSKKGA